MTAKNEDAPAELCGAQAVGGRCALPVGHNMGRLDIPSNHQAVAFVATETPETSAGLVRGLRMLCQCQEAEQCCTICQAAGTIERLERERDAARAEVGCAPNCNRGDYLRGRLAELQSRLDAAGGELPVPFECNVCTPFELSGVELWQRNVPYIKKSDYDALRSAAVAAIARKDAEIARLREDAPCRHEWYQGACAHCHMDVDVFNATRKGRG